MPNVKIGAQLHPQGTTVSSYLAAAATLDSGGVDSLWTWDHFFPLYGDPDGAHFEGYTLLAAMARETSRATLGAMVTCDSYRNPQLLADMIRTIDHLSDGRAVLGIGSGWFERDYTEYGYEFGTAIGRLRALERDLPIIRERLSKLNPPPVGPLPILVGGSGEKVTLRIVARHADAWNAFGPPDGWAAKNALLTEWCEKQDRDPADIERTVCIGVDEIDRWEAYAEAGAEHVIVMTGDPFDVDAVLGLVDAARS